MGMALCRRLTRLRNFCLIRRGFWAGSCWRAGRSAGLKLPGKRSVSSRTCGAWVKKTLLAQQVRRNSGRGAPGGAPVPARQRAPAAVQGRGENQFARLLAAAAARADRFGLRTSPSRRLKRNCASIMASRLARARSSGSPSATPRRCTGTGRPARIFPDSLAGTK